MKTIFRLISLTICLLYISTANSQELSFESLTYDFGTIAEDGGTVTTIFHYKNIGTNPSVIVTAVSSCGCTTPIYSKMPIAPGDSSTVEVTYDPMDRPGKFSRTIQVILAPHNKKYVLTITGDVTPREKSVEENYPFDMGGGLRLSANYFPLSFIEQGKRVESQVKYANTSKRAITVTLRPETQSGELKVDLKQNIAAGEQGSFSIAYDLSGQKNIYGVLNDKYYVDVNGKESKYKLMINGHAVDSFSAEQRNLPAICTIGPRTINIGNMTKGRSSSKESFVIDNPGLSDLVIREVSLGDGVHSSIKKEDIIKSAEQLKVYLWVDSRQIDHGSFSRYITLTVNDPESPVQRVRVTGTVTE